MTDDTLGSDSQHLQRFGQCRPGKMIGDTDGKKKQNEHQRQCREQYFRIDVHASIPI